MPYPLSCFFYIVPTKIHSYFLYPNQFTFNYISPKL
nr:MAG TPA: hypothetical protein [Caudoviricetes sp.]